MRKILSILTATAAGMLMSLHAAAVPAVKGVQRVQQPDGTWINVCVHGDEHCHWLTTPEGQLLTADDDGFYREAPAGSRRQTRRVRQRLMGYEPVPAQGECRALVVLAAFPNMPFAEANTLEKYQRMMNEQGYADDGSTGSVRDYFVSHDYGYYGNNQPITDANAYRMISEACQMADDEWDVDFSQYDNNGDGWVDMVYVIYAGYSESNGAASNTVWPHMYYLKEYDADVELDGVRVNCYATGGERQGTSGETPMGIGLICHEFGHTLGLPDIYDTSTSYPLEIGMATWDVMANGCYNNNSRTPAGYSSFEKSQLGWIDPIVLTEPRTAFELHSLGSSNEAVKLVNPQNPNECFMLENRSRQDLWDAYLPGEGLLVVHINYDSLLFDQNLVNISERDNRVHIVSASGSQGTNTDGAAHTFPGSTGNRHFTAQTKPASIFADGTEINEPITNIAYADGVVTFDYGQRPDVPRLTDETNATADGFRANWTRVGEATSYDVELKNMADGTTRMNRKIQRNRFTFSNLAEGRYAYRVRSSDGLAYSLWSEWREVSVPLTEMDAVETVDADRNTTDGPVTDLSGRRLPSDRRLPRGIYIRNHKKYIIN